ncbi:MAG: glycosyltransferase family 2 protein [Candidatus Omnitrophica bacterium]|nr:glycosyltransferase family 2 protein [Candidatus Omnitrophota bacterium]
MQKTPEKLSLSVILPIYNEEANVELTLKTILAYLEKLTDDFEIIAVNDGSTDQSPKILAELARKHPRISLINSPKNTGYGWALRKGIISAAKDWILLFDADGQFDIADLERLWEAKAGIDFILGWRRRRNDNPYRRLLGSSGNFLANLILRIQPFIKDINCGFKLFKAGLIKPLALMSAGATINFEILYNLKNYRPVFIQLPVSHYPRKAGRATGGDLKNVAILIKESFKIIFKNAPT